MVKSDRSRPEPKQPRIPPLARLTSIPGPVIAAKGTIESSPVAGHDLIGEQLQDLVVSGSRLESLRLPEAGLESSRLTDVVVTGCDLSNADLHKGSWTRVACTDSKLIGVRANESSWQDVHVQDCVADMLQLQQSRCRRVRFSQCRLRGAFFNGTDLTGTVFEGCDLRDADFSHAVLTGVDLRRSIIEGIRIGPEQLRGLTLTQDQALYVAGILGITIGT